MKALSLTQPWAWLVIHGGKDIENRKWNTRFRGRFLVHAAKAMTEDQYDDALFCALRIGGTELTDRIPAFRELERGGIVGSVELVGVVDPHPPLLLWDKDLQQQLKLTHPWHFTDQYGFILRAPRPLPFTPCKGALGFWDASRLRFDCASP